MNKMNGADKLRAEQRARNEERKALAENTRAAWMQAVIAWQFAGNKEASERCKLAAYEFERGLTPRAADKCPHCAGDGYVTNALDGQETCIVCKGTGTCR